MAQQTESLIFAIHHRDLRQWQAQDTRDKRAKGAVLSISRFLIVILRVIVIQTSAKRALFVDLPRH
jgi:hypothetical protein